MKCNEENEREEVFPQRQTKADLEDVDCIDSAAAAHHKVKGQRQKEILNWEKERKWEKEKKQEREWQHTHRVRGKEIERERERKWEGREKVREGMRERWKKRETKENGNEKKKSKKRKKREKVWQNIPTSQGTDQCYGLGRRRIAGILQIFQILIFLFF